MLHSFVAAIIAFLTTLLGLITSRYPRTYFLVAKCPSLYIYCLIYGIIGFVVTLGLDALIDANLLEISGLGTDNPWVRSIAIGISSKAFLNLELFSFSSTGSGTTSPVGLKSLVAIFEPWLMESIELYEHSNMRELVGERAETIKISLSEAQDRAIRDLPERILDKKVVTALKVDIQQKGSIEEVMELYLREFGRKNFDRVFHA